MDYDGDSIPEDNDEHVDIELAACPSCGRNFNPKSLAKHLPICRKVSANAKKRGTFDSTRQRQEALGPDAPVARRLATAAPGKRSTGGSTATAGNKTKVPGWKQKHTELVEAIRSARKVQQFLDKGGSVADLPPPPRSENLDYITCRYCSRRFDPHVHERHAAFCAEQAKRKAISGRTPGSALHKKELLDARAKYQPPSPARRNIQTSQSLRRSQEYPYASSPTSVAASRIRNTRPSTSGMSAAGTRSMTTVPPSPPSHRQDSRRAAAEAGLQWPPNGAGVSISRHTQRPLRATFSQERDLDSVSLDGKSPLPDIPDLKPRLELGSTSSGQSVLSRNMQGGGRASTQVFCANCGVQQPYQQRWNFCPDCGTKYPSSAKFCGECGARR